MLIRSSYHNSTNWLITHEYVAKNALSVVRAGLWVFLAYWFSGVESIPDFANRAGLSRRPTLSGWGAAWVAVGIAFLHHYGVKQGWTPQSPVTKGFLSAGGLTLSFYLLFVITLGPFYEETVLRGFLYAAFRGSYGSVVSVTLILCVTAYFHWGAMTHSLWTTLCFILLGILLCILRERTGNVWNCVLCHAIYNAAGTLRWPIYVAALVVLWPLCAGYGRGTESPSKESN